MASFTNYKIKLSASIIILSHLLNTKNLRRNVYASEIQEGLRQGSILLPILYNMYM
jgi:hypothetical protein